LKATAAIKITAQKTKTIIFFILDLLGTKKIRWTRGRKSIHLMLSQ
jgi:hypothetical protein